MPLYYIWNTTKKSWTKRIKLILLQDINYNSDSLFSIIFSNLSTQIVGRMYFVHHNDVQRLSLRILLLYRKGLSSFESFRTVNGTIYPSFKEACYALGFLSDDSESKSCLEEASNFATPIQIRDLCV